MIYYVFCIHKDLFISKSNEPISLLLKLSCTDSIIFLLFNRLMITAVYFNYQFTLAKQKVNNIISYYMLS